MECKTEDEIQWVAGVYSFLDYGERTDIFRTGPDSVFNQAAIAASAYLHGANNGVLHDNTSFTNFAGADLTTFCNTAGLSAAIAATCNVATGSTTDTYGIAQLELKINNKSSAAFDKLPSLWGSMEYNSWS